MSTEQIFFLISLTGMFFLGRLTSYNKGFKDGVNARRIAGKSPVKMLQVTRAAWLPKR